MKKRRLFHVKKYVKISKINMFKWTYGLFSHNYRVAALNLSWYLTVLGIIPKLIKRIAVNITEYHIMSKLIFLSIINTILDYFNN